METRPEIFQYLDYRKYLSDFFRFLANSDRKYSQRWIAQRAGLKSPQLLSMIVKGDRKLTREQAESLSLVFKLDEREIEYLMILLEIESANHQEHQMEILDRIRFQFQNGLFKSLPSGGFEYIKRWYYPAVRELTSIRKFALATSATRDFISESLMITQDQASEALRFLVQNEFLSISEGRYVRKDPSLRADDFVSPLLMVQYHLQLLERAFQAVQLDREVRHFDSLTFAIPSQHVPKFKDKIKQFVRELDMMAEGSAKKDDIYQLSVQFFSLTGGRAPSPKANKNEVDT